VALFGAPVGMTFEARETRAIWSDNLSVGTLTGCDANPGWTAQRITSRRGETSADAGGLSAPHGRACSSFGPAAQRAQEGRVRVHAQKKIKAAARRRLVFSANAKTL
jgi:hypothetical protein